MEKQREAWADNLKGWLIIIVVLGHAIQFVLDDTYSSNHIWNIIYSFHMPAFVAVSGWFAFRPQRAIDLKKTLSRRFWQLMLPYLCWSVILSVVRWDFSLQSISKIVLDPDLFFWFLWVLFFISLIFSVDIWLSEKFKIEPLLLIGATCMILFGAMVALDLRIFGFQFIAYYFLFYTLGYCVHRFSILQIKNGLALILLFGIWAVLAWFWNMHELPSWIPAIPHVPEALLLYAYRGTTAVIAILFLFGMAPKLLNGSKRTVISRMGQISLGIYVCHLTFVHQIISFCRNSLHISNEWALVVATFAISIIFAVTVSELLLKNRYSARLLLGKER